MTLRRFRITCGYCGNCDKPSKRAKIVAGEANMASGFVVDGLTLQLASVVKSREEELDLLARSSFKTRNPDEPDCGGSHVAGQHS